MTDSGKQSFITDIHQLDKKGAGQAVVWQEEEGRRKKLKLTVPSTLPGEKVRVLIDWPKRRRAHARVEEVIERHPERLDPPCPHFDRCGGCVWQHWRYEGQLRHKTEQVKALLAQHGF
ncbi:MAG: 23S rRNA (uracil(1939)-C(5))-methyltransferase RlmD, partial [Bacillaceae bacterium]|nr:23S rRNA (uracil(1939)-C(5))-methyltransferase RlmD [Bacillaceae bacterium]